MIEPFLFFLIHVDYAISLFDLRLDPAMEESVTKKKKKRKKVKEGLIIIIIRIINTINTVNGVQQ